MIREKKKTYGNNFLEIRNNWVDYLKKLNLSDPEELSEENVAEMMALMKYARIENISKAILSGKIKEYIARPALEDSLVDRDNYLWISKNYKEYLKL